MSTFDLATGTTSKAPVADSMSTAKIRTPALPSALKAGTGGGRGPGGRRASALQKSQTEIKSAMK